MPNFNRGFKSWSERCALSFRKDLGLKPYDPLSYETLAKHLSVELLTPLQITGLPADCKKHLLETDTFGWSAVTLSQGSRQIVIYNPRHSAGRKSSDVMHEFAHIIMGHEPSKIILSPESGLVMRSFDQKQEDEADWLCGCLLLPREALMHARRLRLSDAQISEKYLITASRLKYRTAMTGVDRQFKRRPKQLTPSLSGQSA